MNFFDVSKLRKKGYITVLSIFTVFQYMLPIQVFAEDLKQEPVTQQQVNQKEQQAEEKVDQSSAILPSANDHREINSENVEVKQESTIDKNESSTHKEELENVTISDGKSVDISSEIKEENKQTDNPVVQEVTPEEKVEEPTVYTKNLGDFTVTATVPADAFEEEVLFVAKQVTLDEVSEKAKEHIDPETLAAENAILDIHFVNRKNEEIEPSKEVKIQIQAKKDLFPEDQLENLQITHLIENPNDTITPDRVASANTIAIQPTERSLEKEEAMIVTPTEVTAEFKTKQFSYFMYEIRQKAVIDFNLFNIQDLALKIFLVWYDPNEIDVKHVWNSEKNRWEFTPNGIVNEHQFGRYKQLAGDYFIRVVPSTVGIKSGVDTIEDYQRDPRNATYNLYAPPGFGGQYNGSGKINSPWDKDGDDPYLWIDVSMIARMFGEITKGYSYDHAYAFETGNYFFYDINREPAQENTPEPSKCYHADDPNYYYNGCFYPENYKALVERTGNSIPDIHYIVNNRKNIAKHIRATSIPDRYLVENRIGCKNSNGNDWDPLERCGYYRSDMGDVGAYPNHFNRDPDPNYWWRQYYAYEVAYEWGLENKNGVDHAMAFVYKKDVQDTHDANDLFVIDDTQVKDTGYMVAKPNVDASGTPLYKQQYPGYEVNQYYWQRSFDGIIWETKNDGGVEKPDYVERKNMTGTVYNLTSSNHDAVYDKLSPALDRILVDNHRQQLNYAAVPDDARIVYRLKTVLKKPNDPNAPTVEIVSKGVMTPYFSQLQNGDFEDVRNRDYAGRSDEWLMLPNGTLDLDWRTTAVDGVIEIGSLHPNGTDVDSSGVNQGVNWQYKLTQAADADKGGYQFAELNGNTEGTLYQDVLTPSNSKLNWKLSHMARRNSKGESATDTMYVLIMPTNTALTKFGDGNGKITQATLEQYVNNHLTELNINNYFEDNTDGANIRVEKVTTTAYANNLIGPTVSGSATQDWKKYTGSYRTGENQNLTRFFFMAGPTTLRDEATGAGLYGNFIDTVNFTPTLPDPIAPQGNIGIYKVINGIYPEDLINYSIKIHLRNTKTGQEYTQTLGQKDGGEPFYYKNYDPATRTYTYQALATFINLPSSDYTDYPTYEVWEEVIRNDLSQEYKYENSTFVINGNTSLNVNGRTVSNQYQTDLEHVDEHQTIYIENGKNIYATFTNNFSVIPPKPTAFKRAWQDLKVGGYNLEMGFVNGVTKPASKKLNVLYILDRSRAFTTNEKGKAVKLVNGVATLIDTYLDNLEGDEINYNGTNQVKYGLLEYAHVDSSTNNANFSWTDDFHEITSKINGFTAPSAEPTTPVIANISDSFINKVNEVYTNGRQNGEDTLVVFMESAYNQANYTKLTNLSTTVNSDFVSIVYLKNAGANNNAYTDQGERMIEAINTFYKDFVPYNDNELIMQMELNQIVYDVTRSRPFVKEIKDTLSEYLTLPDQYSLSFDQYDQLDKQLRPQLEVFDLRTNQIVQPDLFATFSTKISQTEYESGILNKFSYRRKIFKIKKGSENGRETLVLELPEGYIPFERYRFTLKFPTKLSQTFMDIEGPIVYSTDSRSILGEADTGTYSGQYGFNSNEYMTSSASATTSSSRVRRALVDENETASSVIYYINDPNVLSYEGLPRPAIRRIQPIKVTKTITGMLLPDEKASVLGNIQIKDSEQEEANTFNLSAPTDENATYDGFTNVYIPETEEGVISEETLNAINEVNADVIDYTLTTSKEVDGENKIVAFTNDYQSNTHGDLTISKQVGGNAGNRNMDFNFQVTVNDGTSENLKYWKISDPNTVMNLQSGNTVALKHGESIVVRVPKDVKVTVQEKLSDDQQDYEVAISGQINNDHPCPVVTDHSDTDPDDTFVAPEGDPCIAENELYAIDTENHIFTINQMQSRANVTFTNTRNIELPTGVITHYGAPIALIFFGFLLVGTLLLYRKHRRNVL